MSKWLEYASSFEEGINNKFFEARASYQTLERLKISLNEKLGKMIFLLGEPGSGKTYLLNRLLYDKELENRPVFFETPISSVREFLIRLIKNMGEEPIDKDIGVLKDQAENLYKDKKTLIMLDEAQLIDEQILEFLRILSDSKVFWIIFAMHEEEGSNILKKSHFKSRPHKVIKLGKLTKDEAQMYVNTQLLFTNDKKVLDFHQDNASLIYKFSGGNFRYLKKLIYTEFELLNEARESEMEDFAEPSKCLLHMAAIEIGLINV